MNIQEGYQHNFEQLLRAAKNGDLCIAECFDAETKKPVITVCAIEEESNGEVLLIPMAKMFDGDPFEELLPPGKFRGRLNA